MIPPSYLKLSRCWLRSFPLITWPVYTQGDELTCRLPTTPSSLGINIIKGFIGCCAILCAQHNG
ncbi:hypothetical protein FRN28_12420 [Vibrio vulnificus]|nr:hypothetical protein [Vibrio vulnificus]